MVEKRNPCGTCPQPIHVIIPAHNEADRIGLLLNDLSMQEPDPDLRYNIIVVDDRSIDRTAKDRRAISRPDADRTHAN